MARYTGSVCRLCRREGTKLFLKGDRCYSGKCSVAKRQTPPGMHGVSRKKVSEYGMQLREKQKIRRTYGLMESQFAATFDRASRVRDMPTGEAMLQLLELRLDNVCYRLGFGVSRPQARQLLLERGALLAEILPLRLEEVFLYEMEALGYSFKSFEKEAENA